METMNNKDIFEGADFMLDMALDGGNKKRSRNDAFYDAEDSRQDEDYIRFLKQINEFWEAKFVEEDEDDPCYIEFLRHLKEHGTAYMCDVSKEHGILFPIVYEAVDDSPAKSKRKSPQSDLKFSYARTSNYDGIERRMSKPHRSHNVRVDRNLNGDGDRSTGPKSSVPVDATYKTFMDNLHMEIGSVFSQYGEHRIYYEVGDKQTCDVGTEPRETDTRSSSLTRRPAAPPVRPPIPPKVTRRPPIPPKVTRRPPTPHPSPPIPSTMTQSPPASRPRPPISSTLTRNPPAPHLRPAVPSSATKRKQNPTDGHTMHRASKKTCKNWEKPQEELYMYWKQLRVYLRKPYDQKEYDDLWEQLGTPKPVLSHRESRSGGSVRPGKLGKCLLDEYSDLKDEIQKDKHCEGKVLNLLRMFKIYLQKIPAGVPRPWKNHSIRSIMPSRPR